MQGTILNFQKETNTGIISGNDGVRYTFTMVDWTNQSTKPKEGLLVDFDTDGKNAKQLIVVKKSAGSSGAKKKSTAALWALLLGWIGAHKFYLNQPIWGIIYLLFCWTGIPLFISLIETISLLLMNDEVFDRRYNF